MKLKYYYSNAEMLLEKSIDFFLLFVIHVKPNITQLHKNHFLNLYVLLLFSSNHRQNITFVLGGHLLVDRGTAILIRLATEWGFLVFKYGLNELKHILALRY